MKRRDFLIGALAVSGASRAFGINAKEGEPAGKIDAKVVRSYLRLIMPTAERVEQFTPIEGH